jgi:hypothetical protein
MRADLDTLLPDAARAPEAPLDPEVLWSRGRRRRAVRHVSAAGGGMAGLAALALVASGLVGGVGTAVPEIAPMAPPAENDTGPVGPDAEADEPTPDASDGDATPHRLGEDAVAAEERRLAGSAGPERSGEPAAPGEEQAPTEPSSTSPDPASGSTSGPTPDWSHASDPCSRHDAEAMQAFIDVVSPVDGQQVADGIALVGCSSVYEGTIRYRLSQDGTVLEDHFVTATAGGPELGEFRHWIPLSTRGTHTLEVFWDSPADGEGERDLTTLSVEAG